MSDEVWELGEDDWDFFCGDRVRMWSRSARAWKVGRVKSCLLTPYQRSSKPRYYGVIFDRTETPRYCRASALQRLDPASTSGSEGGDPPREGTG